MPPVTTASPPVSLQPTENAHDPNPCPRPQWRFPGLRPGDRWCLCALRWKEAFEAGVAPPVVLESTHLRALDFVSLEQLQSCVILK